MIRFTTESGSQYEIKRHYSLEGDGDYLDYVRRAPAAGAEYDNSLRRDNEWIRLHSNTSIEVGSSVILEMEQLGEKPYTYRTTSPVTNIERALA